MADGDSLQVCKATGTEYAAGSTVKSGGAEHESYLRTLLQDNNGRNIGTQF